MLYPRLTVSVHNVFNLADIGSHPKHAPSNAHVSNHAHVVERLPQGAVGWAGPTTEPALGSYDRINTTDLPEEIEARPDKSMECIMSQVSNVSRIGPLSLSYIFTLE